jgi:FkbH-like protein
MVETPPVSQPENSIRFLDRGGYFEASALSADDAARARMYRENARRQKLEESFADYGDYLKSLEMAAEIGPFAPAQLERVTQLINKTNQFNLTTRRYTPGQVAACAESGEYITLAGRLTDKFGDNGIVTALIGHIEGGALDMELWVMSCRVFGRGLEYAMLDALVAEAQRRGVKTVTGWWLPTAKNLLVKDFYAKIGFELAEETDEGRLYIRAVPAAHSPLNTAIEVK